METSNINPDSKSIQASLLRRRAINAADLKKATTNGRILGFVISFLISVFAIIFSTQIPEENPAIGNWVFWLIIAIFISGSIFLFGVLRIRSLNREALNGFLSADDNELSFRTTGSKISILMNKLFAVGMEKEFIDETLRICYLSSTERGFMSITQDFQEYEIVQGPLTGANLANPSGNLAGAEVIRYYIARRRSGGQSVAQLPPYAYDSHKYVKHGLLGERVLDTSFNCDGKMLSIISRGKEYKIPVTAVKDLDIDKATIRGNPTQWDIELTLDPSCGYGSINLNLIDVTYADEVELYLKCLPILLPDNY
ncbi:MAG: hypothetical protein NTY09_14530 [bacterium]|nr:hypothetical protein [bacterium]